MGNTRCYARDMVMSGRRGIVNMMKLVWREGCRSVGEICDGMLSEGWLLQNGMNSREQGNLMMRDMILGEIGGFCRA